MAFISHKAVYGVSAWYATMCLILYPSKHYPLRYDLRELYIVVFFFPGTVPAYWFYSVVFFLPSIHFVLSLTQPDRRPIKLITSLAVKATNYSRSLLFVIEVKFQITFVSLQHGYCTSMTGITAFWQQRFWRNGLGEGSECQCLPFFLNLGGI